MKYETCRGSHQYATDAKFLQRFEYLHMLKDISFGLFEILYGNVWIYFFSDMPIFSIFAMENRILLQKL